MQYSYAVSHKYTNMCIHPHKTLILEKEEKHIKSLPSNNVGIGGMADF